MSDRHVSEQHKTKLGHRMAKKRLVLSSPDGMPLAGREAEVRQTRHSFLFGCAEFSVLPLANGELEAQEREKALDLFSKFLELYNYATLPFYWGRFEPEKGRPDTGRLKAAARWLKDRGCEVKGHPLCWHTVTAPWLLDMSNTDILAAQLERIRREVEDFKGLIDIWDVINEVVIMPIFDKYDNGITRICKELGRIRTVREVFAAAKQANPGAMLLINDFETSEAYDILVEGCLENGIPIDAIGIQSHMHQGCWKQEKTLEILERFSRFKLPIHFTENTLVSGHVMPSRIVDLNDYQVHSWPTTHRGEERQAREMAGHYTTLFTHPAVESITYWNFTDGGWLNAPGGLLRKNGTPKPSYDAMHSLIKGEWWTKPCKVAADASGCIEVEGFKGEYELNCGGKKVSFVLDGIDSCQTLTI